MPRASAPHPPSAPARHPSAHRPGAQLRTAAPWGGAATAVTISCERCPARSSSACDDCVVTLLCDDEADDGPGAVVIDVAEARALRALASGGLVPRRRRTAG